MKRNLLQARQQWEKRWLCVVMISLALLSSAFKPAHCSSAQMQVSRPLNLVQVVDRTLEYHFSTGASKPPLENFISSLSVSSEFKKPAGVFVTLSINGKTRACWGSFNREYDSAVKATVFATIGALTKEYRYAPIKPSELKKLHKQVTLVQSVEPMRSTRLINPLSDGVLVRSGGKSGVILPGEAVDAHYQMVMAKLKAGISPNEPFQLYRLRTKIYD